MKNFIFTTQNNIFSLQKWKKFVNTCIFSKNKWCVACYFRQRVIPYQTIFTAWAKIMKLSSFIDLFDYRSFFLMKNVTPKQLAMGMQTSCWFLCFNRCICCVYPSKISAFCKCAAAEEVLTCFVSIAVASQGSDDKNAYRTNVQTLTKTLCGNHRLMPKRLWLRYVCGHRTGVRCPTTRVEKYALWHR